MDFLFMIALLFWAIQYGFCHCRWIALRFIPLCPVIGLFLWIEMNHSPGPNCGVGTAFEIALIGACIIGIVFGWIVYGAKVTFKKEG